MQLCRYTYKSFRIWEGKNKECAMQKERRERAGEKSAVGENGKHENVLFHVSWKT